MGQQFLITISGWFYYPWSTVFEDIMWQKSILCSVLRYPLNEKSWGKNSIIQDLEFSTFNFKTILRHQIEFWIAFEFWEILYVINMITCIYSPFQKQTLIQNPMYFVIHTLIWTTRKVRAKKQQKQTAFVLLYQPNAKIWSLKSKIECTRKKIKAAV